MSETVAGRVVLGLRLTCAAPVAAQTTVSTGLDHSTGTFGTGQRVDTSGASVGVRIQRKRVGVFANLPVVRVDSPGNVVVVGGPLGLPILIDPTRPVTRKQRSGLGDATVGASVQLLEPRRNHVAVAVTTAVKLPTASAARGLGTGKADFAVGAEVARPGKLTPFAALGYTVVGQPAAYRLENVTTARGGVALRVGRGSEVSLSYNHASRLSAAAADREQVAAGLEANLSPRLSLGLQGSAGLSRGAPDASAGLQLGLRL